HLGGIRAEVERAEITFRYEWRVELHGRARAGNVDRIQFVHAVYVLIRDVNDRRSVRAELVVRAGDIASVHERRIDFRCRPGRRDVDQVKVDDTCHVLVRDVEHRGAIRAEAEPVEYIAIGRKVWIEARGDSRVVQLDQVQLELIEHVLVRSVGNPAPIGTELEFGHDGIGGHCAAQFYRRTRLGKIDQVQLAFGGRVLERGGGDVSAVVPQ